MKKPAILLAAAMLAACASAPQDEEHAWQAYVAFDAALAASADPDWSRHVSRRIHGELIAAGEAERPEITRQIAYPHWLRETAQHYAKPVDGGACLTVVGIDSDGGPASVSVQYTFEDGALKADDFLYQLAERDDELPRQALCPAEFMPQYP